MFLIAHVLFGKQDFVCMKAAVLCFSYASRNLITAKAQARPRGENERDMINK